MTVLMAAYKNDDAERAFIDISDFTIEGWSFFHPNGHVRICGSAELSRAQLVFRRARHTGILATVYTSPAPKQMDATVRNTES